MSQIQKGNCHHLASLWHKQKSESFAKCFLTDGEEILDPSKRRRTKKSQGSSKNIDDLNKCKKQNSGFFSVGLQRTVAYMATVWIGICTSRVRAGKKSKMHFRCFSSFCTHRECRLDGDEKNECDWDPGIRRMGFHIYFECF